MRIEEKKGRRKGWGGNKEVTKISHNEGKTIKKKKEKNRNEENEHGTRREMSMV